MGTDKFDSGAGALTLRLEHISKSYATQVLHDISLEFLSGEVVALLGENGAGKSTLLKIMSGIVTNYEGRIVLNGEKVQLRSPREARKLGIAIIHQELNLVPNRTVWQNIFLGRESKKSGLLKALSVPNERKMRELSNYELERIDARNIDVNTRIDKLSTGQQQLVEIAKALSANSKMLLMDEPTSSLTDDQTESLIKLIHILRDQGLCVIFTTHRITEAFTIADKFVVLRDGELIANVRAGKDVKYEQVIEWMIGRPIEKFYPKRDVKIGDPVLEVRNISTDKTAKASFFVRRGEILGFAGLIGAGRTELFKALFGADPSRDKEIYLRGRKVKIASPRDAIKLKIGYVPEDRKTQSLILDLGVRENMMLASLANFSRHGLLSLKMIRSLVASYVTRINIKLNSQKQHVRYLSGGNQQKVIIAKWLLLRPDVLILDESTRGIDVGAKAEIYNLIGELVGSGIGIILISSEMHELISLCDRVIVMAEGELMTTLEKPEITANRIMDFASLKRNE